MEKKPKRQKRSFEDLVRNPYRVVINGKGKTIHEIINWYFTQISNGFQLTVNEITHILDCSYDYVIESIAPYVLHIRITDTVRPYLLQAEPPASWVPLLTKRMLFSIDDFWRFLQEQAKYELKYIRFRVEEIPEINHWKKENGFSFFQVEKQLNKAFVLLTSSMSEEERKKRKEERTFLPLSLLQGFEKNENWYSVSSIGKEMEFRYRVQVQRFLDARGANPIRLGKLVRYMRIEWEAKEILSYPFLEFQYLQETYGDSLYQVWIQTAKKSK